ncbi:MAG TPA: AraC family transcriptional regulator ligand-binding domain-containing protein, partial [Kofleriaceae bacterium]|nr:AraC family transcriptional regulator ligand-binding domain-containing protein [Kofleriaceae bacterium]
HLAEHSPIGTFEALDYALWASSTFGDALDRLVRFLRIIGDDLTLHVTRAGKWARVHRVVVHDQRHRAECFLAILVLRGRELLGRPLRLREVRFTHRRPADIRAHRRLFHCPIRFGSSVTELVFDVNQLDAPVRSARPGLAAVLDRHLRDLLSRLPQRGSFVHRVHQSIARTLHAGRPSLKTTARALHMSSRTLQRHLQDVGVTHRQIVEDVRRDLAERLLATRRMSITEVAFLLGFEDVSGFRRAYRQWTGMNPSRARAKI